MNNLAIIIPMHEFGKENIELLNKAVESVPQELKIYLSVKNGTDGRKLKNVSDRVTVIDKSEEDTFAELVNQCVNNIEEKWFSILEFDDVYLPNWYDNAKKYMDFMPNASVLMYIEDIVDFNNNQYLGFGNAEAYASSFSNELGYIDNECLQNYFDFYLTGSIFNSDDWKEIGGLKPHIKLTFWYEWLLRATNKDKKVFVIPKVGYKHYLNRKGSLVETYRTQMSQDEIKWHFDLAKKDYLFTNEKEPSYYDYKKKNEE
jgi:hypothetical protein